MFEDILSGIRGFVAVRSWDSTGRVVGKIVSPSGVSRQVVLYVRAALLNLFNTIESRASNIFQRFTSKKSPFQHHTLLRATNMSRRGLAALGLAAAGGAGYYLYTAGGDPKVAQKNLQGHFSVQDLRYTA